MADAVGATDVAARVGSCRRHFRRVPDPSALPLPRFGAATLGDIVRRRYPDAFFVAAIYTGFEERPDCTTALETQVRWPRNVLVASINDTPLHDILMRREFAPIVRGIEPPLPPDEQERLERRYQEINMGVAGDALLVLAPTSELTRTPSDATAWMDLDYRRELHRRTRVRGFTPLPLEQLVRLVTAPPRPWTRFGP